ncbi:MAG: 5-methylcytosine-specific restriction endonuclease system specificity protein McrC [Pseudothermotoga sp.]
MIPIKNIYYMLAYAYSVLREEGYRDFETEEFEDAADLFAAILSKGVLNQIRRGLSRDYIPEHSDSFVLRGKVDISESIKRMTMVKDQLSCSYDVFSANSYLNRIVKTALQMLFESEISRKRREELRTVLVLLHDVEPLNVKNLSWNVNYNRRNRTYKMLISICYLVINGLIHGSAGGSKKLMHFLDEQEMSKLYERFVFEYFRQEFPEIDVTSSWIKWQLDDGVDDFLPSMQSDIMLSKGNRVLIIDAKYYSRITISRYNQPKLHSHNLYQIFAYVKNKEYELRNKPHEVSGLLLYAKTDEEIVPNVTYSMSGNKIAVRALDLNCEFGKIKEQLNSIVDEYFPKL